MSGMVGQLAKRFPAIKQIERSAAHPTQSLEELRRVNIALQNCVLSSDRQRLLLWSPAIIGA